MKYAGYWLLRMVCRFVPSDFGPHLTMRCFLARFLQVSLIAAISFVPVIFAKLVAPEFGLPIESNNSPVTNPYYQAILLFVLQLAKFGVDWLRTTHADTAERLGTLKELSVALDETVGAIERAIEKFAEDPHSKADINRFLQHALKCVEATVRLCTGSPDHQYCRVNLLTFEKNAKIKVRARSEAGRAMGKAIPQDEAIATLAAKYVRDIGVIHYFRWAACFRKVNSVRYKSLTSVDKPQYESILFLPLPAVEGLGQNAIRKGVVCVDAARPFEFLGKEMMVLIRVQAYLHLINLMLINHSTGIEPELT